MSTIDFTQDGDLGIATIANPPLNLVDPSMVDALEALVVRLEGLPLRAVLVRAARSGDSGGGPGTGLPCCSSTSTDSR